MKVYYMYHPVGCKFAELVNIGGMFYEERKHQEHQKIRHQYDGYHGNGYYYGRL